MYLLNCLFDWVSCGLFRRHNYPKILLLGLENAGKSALLHRVASMAPRAALTQLETAEELNAHPGQIIAMDLGGGRRLRPSLIDHLSRICGLSSPDTHPFLSDYLPGADGVIFLVDAADHQRLDEARAALKALLSMDEMFRVPLVVLGNKSEVPGAVSAIELRHRLGLLPASTDQAPVLYRGVGPRPGNGRPLRLFMGSVALGDEVYCALSWLGWVVKRLRDRGGRRCLPTGAVSE